MKLRNQIALLVIVAMAAAAAWHWQEELGLGGLLGQGGSGAVAGGGPRSAAVPVRTAQARTDTVREFFQAVGTAGANEAVTLTSKVSGRVASITFEEGQEVEAGDILLTLENDEIQADIAALQASLEQHRKALQRAEALLDRNTIALARVDELRDEVRGAQARLNADRAKLADTVIRAPFAGRLGLRRVSLGALVQPGDTIVTLDDLNPIKLDFDVPEAAIARLAVGQSILARSAAWPGQPFEGIIRTIDSRVNPTTRAISIRAEIANDALRLKPGMFMTVNLIMDERPDAVLVPESAIMVVGDNHFAYVAENGRAERRSLRLGLRAGGQVEVLEGIAAGETVITAGTQRLRPGAEIHDTDAGSAPSGGGAPVAGS